MKTEGLLEMNQAAPEFFHEHQGSLIDKTYLLTIIFFVESTFPSTMRL
ncbi:MAG: hypothetical protein ACI9RU_000446 [Litorivivens sp.]|jgi:hypothetical protein